MMRIKYKYFIFPFLTLFLFSCAYHPKWEPLIKIPQFYDYKNKVGNLEVVVDPYVAPYKIEYIFNDDLTDGGILPLHIMAWNNDLFDYNLRQSNIIIRSLDGMQYSPIPPDMISKKLKKNTLARVVGFGALGSAFIFLTVPFALGAGIDSYQANKAIKQDVEDKRLKQSGIASKSLFQGFLFFELGDDEDTINQTFNKSYTLFINNIESEKTGEIFNLQIPFRLSRQY